MPENIDEAAAVYARNVDAVYRLCYVYLRSRADAEDATQSAFVKYLQKQPVFQNTAHETAWLLLTAKKLLPRSTALLVAAAAGRAGRAARACRPGDER